MTEIVPSISTVICSTCNATDGHAPNCPEADRPPTAEPAPALPMSPVERQRFANGLRQQLSSRRDVFVIDKFMFEPYGTAVTRFPATSGLTHGNPEIEKLRAQVKTISAATLRLLLDYCENEAWEMDFVSYCAGIFHGRESRPGETAFDLLPDVRERLTADRLGFGHIYGTEGKP